MSTNAYISRFFITGTYDWRTIIGIINFINRTPPRVARAPSPLIYAVLKCCQFWIDCDSLNSYRCYGASHLLEIAAVTGASTTERLIFLSFAIHMIWAANFPNKKKILISRFFQCPTVHMAASYCGPEALCLLSPAALQTLSSVSTLLDLHSL